MATEMAALRRFDRFYRSRIGGLEERLPGSGLSLPEARVLHEVASGESLGPGMLARRLDLDAGYLSRLLAALEQRRLLRRAPAATDRRRQLLALTEEGADAYRTVAARSDAAMATLIAPLAADERRHLIAALARIEQLLAGEQRPPRFLLRPHRPGDLGWIVERHATLYGDEHGWDASYEAFLAEIAAAFLKSFDARHDCCWIAERDGARLGSACLVRVSDEVAKLRLLLVEPAARGLGIGTALLEECLRFARRAGYAKVTLWTNDVLDAARRLYERSAFSLIGREAYHRFGKDLVGETWERVL